MGICDSGKIFVSSKIVIGWIQRMVAPAAYRRRDSAESKVRAMIAELNALRDELADANRKLEVQKRLCDKLAATSGKWPLGELRLSRPHKTGRPGRWSWQAILEDGSVIAASVDAWDTELAAENAALDYCRRIRRSRTVSTYSTTTLDGQSVSRSTR